MKHLSDDERSETLEMRDDGVSVLVFRPWRDGLIQGITLRYLRDDSRSSFDLGQNAAGKLDEVRRNREMFSRVVAREIPVVLTMEQMHGNTVIIRGEIPAKGSGGWESIGPSDGMVTDSEGVLLVATVADCCPIYLFDPVRRAIGLLHAGWRGTAARIMEGGIHRMREAYGTDPADLSIYLGPSIAGACYPVEREVYRHFAPWAPRSPGPEDGWRVDLQRVNTAQAIEMGVDERNIHRSRYCTHCFPDLFHSHRASGGLSGRMAAFLGLRKQISS